MPVVADTQTVRSQGIEHRGNNNSYNSNWVNVNHQMHTA